MKRSERLASAACLDEGHSWTLSHVGIEKKRRGLQGVAYREKICSNCESLKVEHIAWNGRVLNRRYVSGKQYIAAARTLAKDPHERRIVYREEWLKTMFSSSRRANAERQAGQTEDV